MANFVNRISSNLCGLTKSQKDVANYFLYHLDKVAFGTVEDLSHMIGVSTATIVRFSKVIGYAGFAELQKDAQSAVVNANLSARETENQENPDDLLYDSFRMDQQNLEVTMRAIDYKSVEQATQMLSKAKHIYIVGMRVCRTLATYAYINWGQLRGNVRLIHNESDDFAEEVADIREGDVLVAFWVPRYNATTGKIMAWCRKRGAKVILVTNPSFYAGREYCDVFLPCQMKSPSYQSSFVAPIGLINYFTRCLENICGSAAAERLAVLDDILGYNYFIGR